MTNSITAPGTQPVSALVWDVYCKVIDNYGDVGVCWRLARNLVQRGQHVRLFVDNADALAWMADLNDLAHPQLAVHDWHDALDTCGDVVIEAFGANLPESTELALANAAAAGRMLSWLNLEYLSAEPTSKDNHGLSSPVSQGPAGGLMKQFFYPGFVRGTGGILRDDDTYHQAMTPQTLRWPPKSMALFSYESPSLGLLINQATEMGMSIQTAAGRTTAHVQQLADQDDIGVGNIGMLPHCTQQQFDTWLAEQDFLVVRGEDSLTRAIWAGKPFLWHVYPQEDGAHRIKLNAFLDWLDAPTDMRNAFKTLNGTRSLREDTLMFPSDKVRWQAWTQCVRAARSKLLAQNDLVTRLILHLQKTVG